ncbi:hypothetical protein LAG73_11265 [Pseudoxanthomonas japonensis]|nr:hypothetical protein LAG73_11265 [Pseudoxanthomonas japonensis]
MNTTCEEVEALVDAEIARISQSDLVERIREMRVPVRCEQVGWDYGVADQTYPCWVVAHDVEANLVFAYSEHGFGPSYPWGMFVPGPDQSMGMDNSWYLSLEDVVRESISSHGTNSNDTEVN